MSPWAEAFFDDLSMHLVYEIYKRDFELFHYDFENPAQRMPKGEIDLDLLDDVLDRRLVEPTLGEQPEGGVRQLRPRPQLLPFPEADRRVHGHSIALGVDCNLAGVAKWKAPLRQRSREDLPTDNLKSSASATQLVCTGSK